MSKVVFIRSWIPIYKLADIISEHTGYNSPYFNVSRYKGKTTNRTFVIIPEEVAEKLLSLDLEKVDFLEPKYPDVTFDDDFRGLYIKVDEKDDVTQVRKAILDIIHHISCLGVVDRSKCFLSRGNRLFVNGGTDDDVKILYSFINGAKYNIGKKVRYINVNYLRNHKAEEEISDTIDELEMEELM
jgi:hypothetical protein